MATTTNFGWETPDDTDLVKDGALAMRTLGNAIDTSLVDLKGGTTGQVLSKTSNTDMDFTWVTSDDANAIQNAIVDAKGDLIAASAADTPARLAVGNNGETLVADSSASTGLRWQPSQAGGKNSVINGGFDIWQRGTSTTSTSAGYFTADRWANWIASGTGTLERTTTGIPTQFSYGMKYTSSGASGRGRLYHTIETLEAQKYADKTVVLSVYATGTVGKTLSVALFQSATVDNAYNGSFTSIGSQTITLTGTSTRYSATYTVPSTAKTLSIQISNPSGDLYANTETWTITGVQLEYGSVPTEFSRAGGTLAGELQAAQRYYYRVTADGVRALSSGLVYTTTNSLTQLPFPVTMRIRPTALEQSGTASNYSSMTSGTILNNCTAVPAFDQGTSASMAVIIGVASGLVVGNFTYLFGNSSAAYLGWSAEL